MKALLRPFIAVLAAIDSVFASVARPWGHRQNILFRKDLTEGTTPRYRPPQGRPRRRR